MNTFPMSKSKYCKGIQCPKILWMDKNMSEMAVPTTSDAIFQTGTDVGKLAREYFQGCQTVEFNISKTEMCKATDILMDNGAKVIAEASFMYENNFCSVDILRILGSEVHIIEVKSSTEIHDVFYHDMAYQYYVLHNCGLNVTTVINMHINNEYVRGDELELDKLFVLEDCTATILQMQDEIKSRVAHMSTCALADKEPSRELGIYCEKPYECMYKSYCHRHIQNPSVFSIHRLSNKKKYDFYAQGIVSFEDILCKKPSLNDKQWRQVKAYVNNEPPAIDKKAIRKFLDTLTYPLYHLDFETFQQAIPQFKGVKPYMQIPFQYSMHVQDAPNAQLKHYAFLGKEGTDPRRALAEQLCREIPRGACSLAFNMSFEKTVIKNLATLYEDLSEHLMDIHDNMHDLMVPFQQQSFYCKELEGSYSIKKVLPALCGGDPELDYRALDEIHNGSEAMNAFADLPNHSPQEIEKTRQNLLAYCRLDTLAMVKILEQLYLMCEVDYQPCKQMVIKTENKVEKAMNKIESNLDDLLVAQKLVEVLDMLYGEGSKTQVERILISDLEDDYYEKFNQALNDQIFAEQRRRVRKALIDSGIIAYDEKSYQLLVDNVTQKHYDKVRKCLEAKPKEEENAVQEPKQFSIATQKEGKNTVQEPEQFSVATQKEEFKAYVLNQVRNMKPFEFERLTTKLLRACGLEFYPGNRVGDDGVDGYGFIEVSGLFKFKVLVQCKRYHEGNKIANHEIRDLRGAVSTDAYKGLFVTTSSFTPRAKQEADKFPQIDMIDGRQFVDLMLEKKIGVVEQNGMYSMENDYLNHIELEEK